MTLMNYRFLTDDVYLLREGTSKRDIVRYRQNYYEYFIALSDKLP